MIVRNHNMIVFTTKMQTKKRNNTNLKQLSKSEMADVSKPKPVIPKSKPTVSNKKVESIKTKVDNVKKIMNNDKNVKFDIKTNDNDEIIFEIDNNMLTVDKDIIENLDLNSQDDVIKFINEVINLVSDSINKGKRRIIKRGLMIGINYIGSEYELKGCINDTDNLKKLFENKGIMGEKDIIFMNDNKDGELKPTKINIIKQIDDLVEFANKYRDSEVMLFFGYSGHGTYDIDENGDEEDKRDEFICPIDCDTNGCLSDDYIKRYLIDRLGRNVTLFVIMDACHSGTLLDLKYTYNCGKKIECITNNKTGDTLCNVVMISGCLDYQVSADMVAYDKIDKKIERQGAMTTAFIDCYTRGITTNDLIVNMTHWLRRHLQMQTPSITSGKKIDVNSKFILCDYCK